MEGSKISEVIAILCYVEICGVIGEEAFAHTSAMSNLYCASRRHCLPTANNLALRSGSRSPRLCSNSFRVFSFKRELHGSPFSLHQWNLLHVLKISR